MYAIFKNITWPKLKTNQLFFDIKVPIRGFGSGYASFNEWQLPTIIVCCMLNSFGRVSKPSMHVCIQNLFFLEHKSKCIPRMPISTIFQECRYSRLWLVGRPVPSIHQQCEQSSASWSWVTLNPKVDVQTSGLQVSATLHVVHTYWLVLSPIAKAVGQFFIDHLWVSALTEE